MSGTVGNALATIPEMGLLRLRIPAGERYAARAGGIRHAQPHRGELPQRRQRSVRIRQLQYTATDQDVVNIEVNRSRTRFAVPFDRVEGIVDDHQRTSRFVNVGWRHQVARRTWSSASRSELFIGTFLRDGSLATHQGLPTATFTFPGNTNRISLPRIGASGRRAPSRLHRARAPRSRVQDRCAASFTSGHEDSRQRRIRGHRGRRRTRISTAVTWVYTAELDRSIGSMGAPGCARLRQSQRAFAGNQEPGQPPREAELLFPTRPTLLGLLRGLFLPTNVEDLRAITSTAQGGVAAAPTLPERDNFLRARLRASLSIRCCDEAFGVSETKHPRHRRCHGSSHGHRDIGQYRANPCHGIEGVVEIVHRVRYLDT